MTGNDTRQLRQKALRIATGVKVRAYDNAEGSAGG